MRQLAAHAGPAVKCAPALRGRDPLVIWAAGDYAYNVGVGRFCKQVAPLFNAHRWREGCQALGTPKTAKGRELPGLVRRRGDEVAACLHGINS